MINEWELVHVEAVNLIQNVYLVNYEHEPIHSNLTELNWFMLNENTTDDFTEA